MEYVVVAFRSRAHTVRFYELLKKNSINAEIINTPKEAGVGCGLSVKVSFYQFGLVKNVVRAFASPSFAGFFLVKMIGGRRVVKSI